MQWIDIVGGKAPTWAIPLADNCSGWYDHILPMAKESRSEGRQQSTDQGSTCPCLEHQNNRFPPCAGSRNDSASLTRVQDASMKNIMVSQCSSCKENYSANLNVLRNSSHKEDLCPAKSQRLIAVDVFRLLPSEGVCVLESLNSFYNSFLFADHYNPRC